MRSVPGAGRARPHKMLNRAHHARARQGHSAFLGVYTDFLRSFCASSLKMRSVPGAGRARPHKMLNRVHHARACQGHSAFLGVYTDFLRSFCTRSLKMRSVPGAGRARPHKMLNRVHHARAHSARGDRSDHAGTSVSHPLASEICLLGAQWKECGCSSLPLPAPLELQDNRIDVHLY
jgi:hypothetical protein